MARRFISLLIAFALTLCLSAAATADVPTATASKAQAQAAQAAKSCKKVTARAAKAKTPAAAKKLKKTKRRICNRAKRLARVSSTIVRTAAKGGDTSSAAPARPLPANNAPGSSYLVGVNANSNGWGDPGQMLDRVAPSGVNWIREEIYWRDIEPTEGQFDWSHYDELYLDAAQRGMHILPLVGVMPGWAEPTWNWIPENPAKYAGFVAKVAARYGVGGTFWDNHPQLDGGLASTYVEIYNEPYIDYFAANGIDAARYANLVIAAADAGRAANPGTKYLASASDMDGNGQDWTRKMFAARPELADRVDGFAVHPYGPDLTNYHPDYGTSFRRTMEQTQSALAENGAADKPIWVTEMGWSTCTTSSDCVSEQRQEDLTRELAHVLDTTYSGSVRALFLYHFMDPDSSSDGVQGHFGLTTDGGRHKPGYDALVDIAATHN